MQTGDTAVSAGCPGFECRGSKVPVCCPNPPAAGTCALSSCEHHLCCCADNDARLALLPNDPFQVGECNPATAPC